VQTSFDRFAQPVGLRGAQFKLAGTMLRIAIVTGRFSDRRLSAGLSSPAGSDRTPVMLSAERERLMAVTLTWIESPGESVCCRATASSQSPLHERITSSSSRALWRRSGASPAAADARSCESAVRAFKSPGTLAAG
jgi:hypothetical protein